ncbi:MAG: sulfotransferase [Anaerolineae bacterium]|nr:sulfotransferase [Anaerolineae bacterium]
MGLDVKYANLRSRIFLKRRFEEQFCIPLQQPVKQVESFMLWYEENVLKVDTSDIKIDRPIFLVGLPRSGTTMMQDLLCAHPQIAYITNIMHQFRKAPCAAEDLRKRLKLDFEGERYLRDSVKVSLGSPNEGHAFFIDWYGLDPYALEYVKHDLSDFPLEQIEQARDTMRKIIWCFKGKGVRFFNKNPGLTVYITLLKDMFPDAKIIHMVRDARKCANSMLKLFKHNQAQEIKVRDKLGLDRDRYFIPYPRVPKLVEYLEAYGPNDIRTTANIWNDTITMVAEQKDDVPFFYEVRFEDILADPQVEIKKILDFCELPEVEDQSTPFWQKIKKIGKVSHTNNYGNFEMVEEICKTYMKQYGYL